ncbi:MAG TPA: twin-arginine translocase TatA/TatE family subunit [Bryobacteraceae bacterium]|jgi:sec-independent protein translocase protein TatA
MQPVMTAGISIEHLLLFAGIFILLFGGKKVGEFGKGLGEGIRNFRTAMKDDKPKDGESPKEPDKIEAK